VQLGYSVRFVTAQQFANAILAAASRVEVERVLHPLIHCDLLIVDEFGYLPVASQLGPALYELISARYLRRATVITSNKSLANWGEVIGGDTALMMAMIDRLLHHGEVFYLRGASHRMRGKESVVLPPQGTPENGLAPTGTESQPVLGNKDAERGTPSAVRDAPRPGRNEQARGRST
jgi:DNA replication protein DnaC